MLFLTLLPINKCHRYAWKKLTPASIAPNSPQISQFSSPASMNDGPGTLPTPAPNDRKSVILGHVYWIFKLSLHRATAPISRPIPARDVGPPSWVWMRFFRGQREDGVTLWLRCAGKRTTCTCWTNEGDTHRHTHSHITGKWCNGGGWKRLHGSTATQRWIINED